MHRLSLDRIAAASAQIDPVFLHTPQFHAESLDERLGCRLVVKVETINPIRSFKGRGACHFVAQVTDTAPLVCASAGNFGQAMAYACRRRGIPLIVYASVHANPLKLTRMRQLGAEVRLAGADFDAAKDEADAVAARDGLRLVVDGLEPAIAEGAGTMGVELTAGGMALDAVLLPLGNGALATGVGRWVKAMQPATQVVAVAAAGAPCMVESWASGAQLSYPTMATIADGIGVRVPIAEAVADMHGTVDATQLVSDDQILAAMQLLHAHTGLVVEPSGAAGVAALLADPSRYAGQTVATVLCGGNLTPAQMGAWLSAE
ncbi:MAG: pyridoxal-phosphate dependent enzyme [Gemmatimonadaceae bacterium]